MEYTLPALLGLLSVGSIIHYRKLVSRLAPFDPQVRHFGLADWIFASILAVLFSLTIANSIGQKAIINRDVIITNCVMYGFLVVMICTVMIGAGRNPIRIFGLNWTNWPQGLLYTLLSLAAALPLVWMTHLASGKLLGAEDQQQDVLEYLTNPSTSWENKGLLIVMAVIMAPIAEEVIFRGYFYGILRDVAGRWWAIVISSLLFAAIHVHIPALAGLFVLAVTLCLVYERTRSLWAPIIMHAIFNSITVIGVLLWPAATK